MEIQSLMNLKSGESIRLYKTECSYKGIIVIVYQGFVI